MKTISRYIMTLALLLTAVTGAWAISDPNSVSWDNHIWSGWTDSETTHTVGDITITCSGNAKAYESTSSGEPLALQAGANDAITFTSNGKPFASIAIMTDDELNVAGWTYNSSTRSYEWSGEPTTSVTLSGCNINADYIIFTFGTAEAPVTVAWNAATKTGTFEMPGSDVVLTPLYAPAAKWDVVENLEQLPAALEGIIAGQDAAIVTAGQSAQGTVMYAVTTSAEAAPELTAFSATVPTAKDYDDATTLYVWYYIQGQNTPDGQEATEENTFNDTEICATPLTVQVLSNKFDITFNAANANTIEADKATVTVDDEAAEVKEGKLTGVKMGSEVKLEAKPGYKFRKVEVKKKEAAPTLKDALKDGATVVITYTWQGAITTFTYTNNGGNYTGGATGYDAEYFANGMSKDGTTLKFTASNPDFPQANVSIDFFTDSNEYYFNSKGDAFDSFTISVNGTDVTSQLKEVK